MNIRHMVFRFLSFRIRKKFRHLCRIFIKNCRMIWGVKFQTTAIWKMGRSGCTAFEYRAYGAGASGKFPSGKRMGAVYGCDHSGSECAGSSDCVYVVGTSGAEQNTDAYKSKAPDLKGTASKSAFRVSRVLWMQTFQSGKSVSKRTWNRADWLADRRHLRNFLIKEECPIVQWTMGRIMKK